MSYYIIDEHGIERAVSQDAYREWRYSAYGMSRRMVGWNPVGDYTVKTVFLGYDVSHGGSLNPLVYATNVMRNLGLRVLDHPLSDYRETYSTWDEAIEGHEEMIERVREHMALLTAPSVPEAQAAIEHAMAVGTATLMDRTGEAYWLTKRIADKHLRYPDLYREALRCVLTEQLDNTPDGELGFLDPALCNTWGM